MAEQSNALIYITTKGARLELRFDGETMWMTQAQIAELFSVTRENVNIHLASIYETDELDREATCKEVLQVRTEGIREVERKVLTYNLDAIISVGYRVNSKQGTLFRKWATSALVQLATKGFVVDSDKLKGNADRLRELREIIADLRSDEANLYAELRGICAMCSDYDASTKASRDFFATFQNRMLYAITEHTAAEVIKSRANAKSDNMGLATWKGDHVLKSDTTVAKNYLGKIELEDLNRLVGMVLDFFEDQTKRGFLVAMHDADAKLKEILTINRRHMLKDAGRVSAKAAEQHASEQYQLHVAQRRMKEITALNETAKALPKPGRTPRPKKSV